MLKTAKDTIYIIFGIICAIVIGSLWLGLGQPDPVQQHEEYLSQQYDEYLSQQIDEYNRTTMPNNDYQVKELNDRIDRMAEQYQKDLNCIKSGSSFC